MKRENPDLALIVIDYIGLMQVPGRGDNRVQEVSEISRSLKALAKELNLQIGDKLKLAIPKTDTSLLGNIPRFKTLKIDGIFDFGMFEYDSNLVFISLELSRKWLCARTRISREAQR